MKLANQAIRIPKDTPLNAQRPLNVLTNAQKRELLGHAIEKCLTDKEKLYFFEYVSGESMPQIAEKHGINKSTVCRLVNKAKRKVAWYVDNIYIAKIEIE